MPADQGSQVVTLKYYTIANSTEVNKRFLDIRPTGIYKGGYLSIVDSSHAQISTFEAEITDGTYQVKVQTTTTVNLSVSSATPYIVLRWVYTGAVSDYAEILAVATPSTYDVIVGKCSFSGGGALQGFAYDERTTPDVQRLFLKVEPTAATELKVRIRAGRITIASGVIDIPDQKSSLFVAPSANSKIYLVYVNSETGAIAIDSSGTEAASPVAPDYTGRLVLAEVTLASTSTNITESMITDTRSFLSKPIEPDDTTIEYDSDGLLSVKDSSIDDDKLGDITTLFGTPTNQDSLGATLLGNTSSGTGNQYKATGDGMLFVKHYSTLPDMQIYIKFLDVGSFIAVYNEDQNAGNYISTSIPIGKNDVFYVTTSRSSATFTIYWRPFGTSQLIKQ